MNKEVLYILNKKLPLDIIYNLIIPFTYVFQNKELLEDITNYRETINYIENFKAYTSILRTQVNVKRDVYIIIYWHHFHWIIEYIIKQYKRKLIYVGVELEKFEFGLEDKIRKISNIAPFNKVFNIYWGLLEPFKRKQIIEIMDSFNSN